MAGLSPNELHPFAFRSPASFAVTHGSGPGEAAAMTLPASASSMRPWKTRLARVTTSRCVRSPPGQAGGS